MTNARNPALLGHPLLRHSGLRRPDLLGSRKDLFARYARFAVAGAAIVAGMELTGCSNSASAEGTASIAPTAVTVATPVRASITNRSELTGQFSAINQVTLLAQVSGYLTEIHFRDGQIVRKGDLLFVIDPRPYEIQLQQANAQYQTARAALTLANKELDRATQLAKAGAQAVSVLDQATQAQQAAEASVRTAQAAIGSARLNLEFTHIRAPFTGRMSMRRVSIGSLVSAGTSATPLTSIVSLDPLYLDFDMSEADYAAYRHSIAGQPDAKPSVALSVEGEHPWGRSASLDFIDNQIDRSSGTIHARATVANPDTILAPGQFARIRVPVSTPQWNLLIPDAAIGTDQAGKSVMVVGQDGVASPRMIEVGALQDNGLRVITRGLKPTDHVVINGLMQIRPGSKVAAHLGPIVTEAKN